MNITTAQRQTVTAPVCKAMEILHFTDLIPLIQNTTEKGQDATWLTLMDRIRQHLDDFLVKVRGTATEEIISPLVDEMELALMAARSRHLHPAGSRL